MSAAAVTSSLPGRWQPVVWTITGVAVAAGAWVVYTTVTTTATRTTNTSRSGLRRSNAVHRSNAVRVTDRAPLLDEDDIQQHQIDPVDQENDAMRRREDDDDNDNMDIEDAAVTAHVDIQQGPTDMVRPFGTLIVNEGGVTLVIDLSVESDWPSPESLTGNLGVSPERAQYMNHAIQGASLSTVLHHVFDYVMNEPMPDPMGFYGLSHVTEWVQLQMDSNVDEDELDTSFLQAQSELQNRFMGLDPGLVHHALTLYASHEVRIAAPIAQPTIQMAQVPDIGQQTARYVQQGFNQPPPDEESQGLKGLLYYIAQTEETRRATEHRGIGCDHCSTFPILGVRYRCLNCPDYDLCATCEDQDVHIKTHTFEKIKIPIPYLSQAVDVVPNRYPGIDGHPHLSSGARLILTQKFELEGSTVDAHYSQFNCLANVYTHPDSNGIPIAIDRWAFGRVFTSPRWPQGVSSTTLLDRMFHFYDTDQNGLIGFEEFLSGLQYLRGPNRYAELHRALQGYDFDGQGYISRADMLRLLRPKYKIQQEMIRISVESQQTEALMRENMSVIRGGQPISSLFNNQPIPPADHTSRGTNGKEADPFGDMQTLPGAHTVLDENDPWPKDSNFALGDRRVIMLPANATAAEIEAVADRIFGRQDEAEPAQNEQPVTPQEASTEDENTTEALDETLEYDYTSRAAQRLRDQDVTWQVVEANFNELLDPIFKAAEKRDADPKVSASREYRARWNVEITTFKEKYIAEHPEARPPWEDSNVNRNRNSAALRDRDAPAPALTSHPPRLQPSAPLVPTDEESLMRLEQAIATTPLEDLLAASGYSTIEPVNGVQTQVPDEVLENYSDMVPTTHLIHLDEESERQLVAAIESTARDQATQSTTNQEITMEGDSTTEFITSISTNNAAAAEHAAEEPAIPATPTPEQTAPKSTETNDVAQIHLPPTETLIVELLIHERIENDIARRGAPGKCSLQEIEIIATKDRSGHIRGLLKSWLDWAAF